MQPKNKWEQSILDLSDELPLIGKREIAWAKENLFDHYGKKTKAGILCMDCGTKFNLSELFKAKRCPSCKRLLTITDSRKRVYRETRYLRIIEVYKGYQLIRYEAFNKETRTDKLPKVYHFSAIEHWISPTGRYLLISRYRNLSLGRYFHPWWGYMVIKSYEQQKHDFTPDGTYPRQEFLPCFEYTKDFKNIYGYGYAAFLSIKADPIGETLLKRGEHELLKIFFTHRKVVHKFWPAIKICFRNGYDLSDPTLWLDYMEALYTFKKDVWNKYYACPIDLHREHDKWENRRVKLIKKNKEERMLNKNRLEQEKYLKEKGKYLDLEFKDGELTIRPLQSVSEVFEEGEEMKHCVYSGNYHKKKDTLLLTAKVNEKRMETIEFSLVTNKVVQSRGKCNLNTKYHDRIIDLLEGGAEEIRRMQLTKRRKTKSGRSAALSI